MDLSRFGGIINTKSDIITQINKTLDMTFL